MTAMTIALVLASFIGFLVLFLLMLPRSSAQTALLEQATRDARVSAEETESRSWRSVVSTDFLAKPFGAIRKLMTPKPDPELVRRLLLAGYRKPAHADIFLGARLALPVVLGFLVALLVTGNVLFFFFITIVIAFFIPDFWLSHAINKRREKIRLSVPDALDLLAICMEAGLGLDQGIVRVGQELHVSHPELSEELLQINFEQRAGVPRMTAWKSFADRVDLENVRSFVAMLIQTDRFGTPLSKSLGNFSDALRTQRRQQAEERAAKTTIKLVPPLVFFIFPNIAISTVVPAILTVMKNIGHIVD
ncbi:MAG: secretion system protein [Acidobacteria bacterium]|nr:MAG: secretion system protein [Acidobacteriota bacterium]